VKRLILCCTSESQEGSDKCSRTKDSCQVSDGQIPRETEKIKKVAMTIGSPVFGTHLVFSMRQSLGFALMACACKVAMLSDHINRHDRPKRMPVWPVFN
jgi:hypothetical protein